MGPLPQGGHSVAVGTQPLPAVCHPPVTQHEPVLLALAGGSVEWASPQHAAPKGCTTSDTRWSARKSSLQSCRLDSRLPHPETVLQLPMGGSLPGCLLLQWRHVSNAAGLPKYRCHPAQMQMRQRLAHARRHPMQASASELTRLQHQVQGVCKHKKHNSRPTGPNLRPHAGQGTSPSRYPSRCARCPSAL